MTDSVDSILSQTFTNYEFIIIDDGSTDNTWNMLNKYKDPRIRLYRNSKNVGLAISLNRGLMFARGDYLARMDVDDISAPDRIQKQKEFLDKHPGIALVGSWVKEIKSTGKKYRVVNYLTDPIVLRWRLLFVNSFAHSSIMMRTSVARYMGGYSEKLLFVEDYDLWSRISFRWEITNIPEVLLIRRDLKEGISYLYREKQYENSNIIAKRNIYNIMGEQIDNEIFEKILLLYKYSHKILTVNDISELYQYLRRIIYRFNIKYNYNKKYLIKKLNVEVATHIFFLITHNNTSLKQKVRMWIFWLKKIKPNMYYIIYIFLSNRTRIGVRLKTFLST